MIEWTKLLLVDFLVPLAWPGVTLATIWIFRETLRDAAGRVTDFYIDLKKGTAKLKLQVVSQVPQLPRDEVLIIENPEPPTTVDRISHPDSRPSPPVPKL